MMRGNESRSANRNASLVVLSYISAEADEGPGVPAARRGGPEE